MMAMRRWLGVSHRVIGLMPYLILTKKGTLISTTTAQLLTSLDNETNKIKASVSNFDTEISCRFKE